MPYYRHSPTHSASTLSQCTCTLKHAFTAHACTHTHTHTHTHTCACRDVISVNQDKLGIQGRLVSMSSVADPQIISVREKHTPAAVSKHAAVMSEGGGRERERERESE